MKSYFSLFRNYGNFSGFMKRSAYWAAMIIHALILTVPLVPGILFLLDRSPLLPAALDLANSNSIIAKIYFPWVLPLWCFYFLLMIIPVLSATVRRLHTLPRRGWWLLIGLIPVAGGFILLIWLLQKGTWEELQKRLKRAAGDSELAKTLGTAMKIADRPRGGKWFFIVFALLAFSGWFLNRQIMESGSLRLAVTDIRTAISRTVDSLPFRERDPETTATPAQTAEPESTPPTKTATVPTMEPTVVPAGILSAIPGEPITMRANGAVFYLINDKALASALAVSVEDYTACVEADVCEMPEKITMLAYRGMLPDGAAKLPMVYVTRSQAASYCEWLGLRLPTADEWQTAAKTSSVTEYTPENANCIGTDRSGWISTRDQLAQTVPVDAFGEFASDHGMIQMAGNVWEWVIASDADEGTALALGGAWNSYPDNIGPDASLVTLANYAANNIGFRCFADADALTEDRFEGGIEEIDAEPIEEAAVELANSEETDIDQSLEKEPEQFPGSEDETNSLIRPADGAPMAFITSGTFLMGASNGAIDEKPLHEVSLSAYRMDIYEVTNARYTACVNAGACTPPHAEKSFRRTDYYGNPEYDNYPVIYVDWQQAENYCEWIGGRLPTEAEWEYAAKGPDGNNYPWGSEFIAENLNYSGTGAYETEPVDETPLDVSAFGIYNLGGNVSEWVYDRYQENWYTVTTQTQDPTGPENGAYRVIRGGSTQTGQNNARTADRFYANASSYNLDRGFRCVIPGE